MHKPWIIALCAGIDLRNDIGGVVGLFIQGSNSVAWFTIGPIENEKTPNRVTRCLKEYHIRLYK